MVVHSVYSTERVGPRAVELVARLARNASAGADLLTMQVVLACHHYNQMDTSFHQCLDCSKLSGACIC